MEIGKYKLGARTLPAHGEFTTRERHFPLIESQTSEYHVRRSRYCILGRINQNMRDPKIIVQLRLVKESDRRFSFYGVYNVGVAGRLATNSAHTRLRSSHSWSATRLTLVSLEIMEAKP